MLKQDITTGRLMILTDEVIQALTPREFFKYIEEGFVPCLLIRDKNVETGDVEYMYEFSSTYNMSTPYGLSIGGALYSSQDLDLPYTKQ